MRIITRPDFDGVVCAALLSEVHSITQPILWVEPNDMQCGRVSVGRQDIIANLPYHPDCALWFDHHYTNKPEMPFEGAYALAPSAAGLVHEYYKGRFQDEYRELIDATDKIDAADLTMDEVMHPENHPYVLVSMTVSGRNPGDEPYWNHLVNLVRRHSIEKITVDAEVSRRCQAAVAQNQSFKILLKAHTRMDGHVSVSDFRSLDEDPKGNRFLVYSLFPDAIVSVKVRRDPQHPDKVIIGVGHSIFNRRCRVNVGLMLSEYNGGGHRGAGSCTVSQEAADACLEKIVAALKENRPNE